MADLRNMNTAQLRVAMRREGEFWNSYIATRDSMEGALLVASIRIAMVERPDARDRYRQLMQQIVADQLSELGAEVLGWDLAPAPAHERTGNA